MTKSDKGGRGSSQTVMSPSINFKEKCVGRLFMKIMIFLLIDCYLELFTSTLLSSKNKYFRFPNSKYNRMHLSRDKLGYILVMKGQQFGYPQFDPTYPIYEALSNMVFPTLSRGIKMSWLHSFT